LPNDTAVIKAKYIFSNENKGQAYVRIHSNFVAASHRILYVLNIEDYRVICEYNICQWNTLFKCVQELLWVAKPSDMTF